MRTAGKTKLLPILILVLGYFVASAAEKEIIKDKSPDGKFALRVWKGEEGWEAAIVDLRSKKPVEYLDVYGNCGRYATPVVERFKASRSIRA